ncbi:hypothetical protein D3C71_1853830 [compost metagenome]
MGDQHHVIQQETKELPPPLHIPDGLPLKKPGEFLRLTGQTDDPRQLHGDGSDGFSFDQHLQCALDRFHLWQLRHPVIPPRYWLGN